MTRTARRVATLTTAAVIGSWLITAPVTTQPTHTPAVVLDVTGSLMTDEVGMITGDLTVTVAGTRVRTQYRGAAEWYTAVRCATEDSVACVWVGPAQGNGHGSVVVNSRTD